MANPSPGPLPLIPVTISYQPALYWALPIYIADQRSYFSDLGLDVSYKTYPSGAPQIADAVENAAWDIGASGTVPCILGALEEPQIQTIGISNDESAANALVGNAEGIALYDMLDLSTEDVTIAITPNSTGQYAVEECLRSKGQEIQWMDDHFVLQYVLVLDLNVAARDVSRTRRTKREIGQSRGACTFV